MANRLLAPGARLAAPGGRLQTTADAYTGYTVTPTEPTPWLRYGSKPGTGTTFVTDSSGISQIQPEIGPYLNPGYQPFTLSAAPGLGGIMVPSASDGIRFYETASGVPSAILGNGSRCFFLLVKYANAELREFYGYGTASSRSLFDFQNVPGTGDGTRFGADSITHAPVAGRPNQWVLYAVTYVDSTNTLITEDGYNTTTETISGGLTTTVSSYDKLRLGTGRTGAGYSDVSQYAHFEVFTEAPGATVRATIRNRIRALYGNAFL